MILAVKAPSVLSCLWHKMMNNSTWTHKKLTKVQCSCTMYVNTILIQLFMQSCLLLMHPFWHVFFHQNGKKPRLHQFQKTATMNRQTTIGPSHFYQFYLMKEHRLVSRHVKFLLVYISSLPKSIACTEQVSYCSGLSQQQCRWGATMCHSDLSHCVSRYFPVEFPWFLSDTTQVSKNSHQLRNLHWFL